MTLNSSPTIVTCVSRPNQPCNQGRSQTFSFGGATGGASFATRGAVNGLCRTFRKRPEKFCGATGGPGKIWGESGPPGTPLAPPLHVTLRSLCNNMLKVERLGKNVVSICLNSTKNIIWPLLTIFPIFFKLTFSLLRSQVL